MNTKFFPLIIAAAVVLVSCSESTPTTEDAGAPEVEPTVTVQTVKLEKGTIAATISAYGAVNALADEMESVSVQYESRIVRIRVSAGEPVENGQALIEIEPSPDALLQLADAKSAAESLQTQLDETQRRFDLKLAVNQDLQQAKRAAQDASARFASLMERGADKRTTLNADVGGVVNGIPIQIGDIVPAGTPLISIVPESQIEVRLGIEPESAESLKKGDPVRVVAVNRDGVEVKGAVRLVTKRVNPQTRLVDIYVTVPPNSPLLIEGYVRGDIEVQQKEALIAPREAILPRENGPVLFTVLDGKAVEHTVATGIETDTQTEVISDSIKPGDEVVTMGNSQLLDGMAVTNSAP